MALLQQAKFGIALIAASGLGFAASAQAQQVNQSDAGLASAALTTGNASDAVDRLASELERSPNDPALLINIGIAYAHMGDEAAALSHFKAALKSREVIELDTADGRTTNSRRLARQAMAMLKRGDFRPDAVAANLDN